MEKIKACPFCGREATMIDCEIHPRWYIKCTYTYCGVEQPHCYATKEASIKAWNRRAKEIERGKKMKKVWIVTMWQDDENGSGHSYVWKVCSTEEKAKEFANQHPEWTDVEEYEFE